MSIRPSNAAIALVVVLAGILLTTLVPQGPFRDLGSAEAASASYSYAENGTAAVATFTATDPDGDPITWSLTGDDKKSFTITGGVLRFKKSPNFEAPGSTDSDNVYSITVEASGGTLGVTVTVTNVDESGVASLDKPQPQAGRDLTASLTDDDDGITGQTWQWSRGTSASGPWTAIAKATSATRAPASGDVGYYLRATVTYTDSFGSGKTASAVSANAVEAKTLANAKPSFKDQDDDDNGSTVLDDIQVNRKVMEGDAGMAVGKPVTATDADGDILVYTLTSSTTVSVDTNDGVANDAGTRVPRFTIDSASGQIRTAVKLNFEAPAEDDANCIVRNGCRVEVTATDPSGASESQLVKIEITDVNEAPVFNSPENSGANAVETLWIEEDGTEESDEQLYTSSAGSAESDNRNANYVADDPDVADDTETYTLEGADKDFFEINNGALTAKNTTSANYEEKKSYSITVVVTGSDANDATRKKMTLRRDVTINVIDKEDTGIVTLSQREPQEGVAVVATLSDPDGGVSVSEWKWYQQNETNNDCPDDFTGTQINDAKSSTYMPKETDVTGTVNSQVGQVPEG